MPRLTTPNNAMDVCMRYVVTTARTVLKSMTVWIVTISTTAEILRIVLCHRIFETQNMFFETNNFPRTCMNKRLRKSILAAGWFVRSYGRSLRHSWKVPFIAMCLATIRKIPWETCSKIAAIATWHFDQQGEPVIMPGIYGVFWKPKMLWTFM